MKKKIIIIILLILLIISSLMLSRVIIAKKILNKIEKLSNNYESLHLTITTYDDKNKVALINEKMFSKNSKYELLNKVYSKHIFENDENNSFDETIGYTLLDNEKHYGFYFEESPEEPLHLKDKYEIEDMSSKEIKETEKAKLGYNEAKEMLKNIFKYNITSEKIDGKDCYKVNMIFDNLILYFSKDNGLLIKEISTLTDVSVTDYKYTFDKVEDKDFEFLLNLEE